MPATNTTIELQAALDKAKSVKNINRDIDKIKGQLKPLELQVKPDAKTLQNFDSIKNGLANLCKEAAANISSQIAAGLKEAENASGSSLNNMLSLWGTFGDAVEKILSSDSIVSDFNGLTKLISGLNSTTKGALSSLATIGLGTGITAFVKNFA